MDRALIQLAQACNIEITDVKNVWPDQVDDDIREFLASTDPRAIFVVEEPDGLIIGPPPRGTDPIRAVVVAKPKGPLPEVDWEKYVVVTALPLGEGAVYPYLHSLVTSTILPLFDSTSTTISNQTRHKLVEAERALEQLLRHTQVSFVDLTSGSLVDRAKAAIEQLESSDSPQTIDLNELQLVVNLWKQQVSQLAASDRDVSDGTASDEIGFWVTLELALLQVQEQLKSPLITKVWQILEDNKRFHATHNFSGDTGLTEALVRVQGYTQVLFKDIPLGEMLASSSVEALVQATEEVFTFLNRKLRISAYPAHRCVAFVEAIGRDFGSLLLKITANEIDKRTAFESLGDFDQHTAFEYVSQLRAVNAGVIFAADAWDSMVRDFATLARDLMRRRAEKFVVVKVNTIHSGLVSRIKAFDNLLMKYCELRPLLADSSSTAKAVDLSLTDVVKCERLLTLEEKSWLKLESRYAQQTQLAEQAIAKELMHSLEAADSEMHSDGILSVFTSYQTVLALPQVRAVTHKFQSSLLESAKQELLLSEKLSHDLPEDLIERIMRIQQLKLRVSEIHERLQIIFGDEWQEHADAAHIGRACISLQASLNPSEELANWIDSIQRFKSAAGPSNSQAPLSEDIILTVQLGRIVVTGATDSAHVILRKLKALGYRFDPSLISKADSWAEESIARQRISDCLGIIEAINQTITAYPRIIYADNVSVASQRVFDFIQVGLNELTWNHSGLAEYVIEFEKAVALLDAGVSRIVETDATVTSALTTYVGKSAKELLSLQHEVDEMSNKVMSLSYSNAIKTDLNQVIIKRLSEIISQWQPTIQNARVEVRNQIITVVPDLESCVTNWYKDLSMLVNPILSNFTEISPILDANLSAALDRVAEARLAAQLDIHQWTQLQPLWDLRISDVLDKLGESSELENSTLVLWLECLGQLQNAGTFRYSPVSRLELDTKEATLIVESKCQVWRDALIQGIGAQTQLKSNNLSKNSQKIRRDLEHSRIDLSGVMFKGLAALKSASSFIASAHIQIPSLVEANRSLHRCRYSFPSSWISSDQLQSELASLTSQVEKRTSDLEQAKPRILKELESKTATLISESQELSSKWLLNKPIQPNIDPEVAIRSLTDMNRQLDDLFEETCTSRKAFSDLGTKSPTSLENLFKQVKAWKSESESLRSGWTDISSGWQQIKVVGSRTFFGLSPSKLAQDVSRVRKFCEELPDNSKQLPAFTKLENQIIAIESESLPIILLLKSSDAIQAHHLTQLVPQLTLSKAAECTIADLWQKLPSKDIASAIVESAEGEHQLLKYLTNVQKKWSEMKLSGKNFAIRNLDAVLQLIGDQLSAFSAMAGSPHFKAVSNQVQDWERKLSAARQVFDLFVDLQQQYIYLHGILSSKTVASVLKAESRRFKDYAEEFLQFYARAEGQLALSFAGIPRLGTNISRLLKQFSNLHKGLIGFLENQRQRFPRLFFVGDDDLLEIVGSSIEIWGSKHLSSIFPGVASIDFDSGKVVSPQGETLKLHSNTFPRDDNVELLILLEKEIAASIKQEICHAVSQLEDAWKNTISFGKWLESFTVQSTLVALRERWTRIVFDSSKTEGYLSSANEQYTKLLQWLSDAGDDSLLWSRRKESVVAELIYEQQHLQPRFPRLLIGIVILENSDLFVKCGSETWVYGYEYLGATEPIVRTQVTDDLYLCAVSALSQGKGGSIVGPAGTGKTESVKSLGNLMGRRVVVFNCDDQFDYQTVVRMMSGCAATQSWACFDEFNRLTRSVLSSIAQVVADSCKRSPVFVTMNPGYSGRAILPPNMRDQFRQFILAQPESKEIARVLVYAHRKIASESADSAVQLLDCLSKKVSNQTHYDWGLRALKSVLRVCFMLNGDMRQACEIAIRPRLVPKDIEIFSEELARLFGFNENSQATGKLKFAQKVCSTEMLVEGQFREAMINLDTFRNLFAGTMLLGPTGCGKTTVWKELARIYNAETVVIDPSSISKSTLLGSLDKITREWTDGILSRVLRKVSANLRGEMSKVWFIVFDGEIEPDWAEALNSLLDDNRHLTLASGEILTLPSQVHLIFEATNISKATPATISRCGIICMPDYNPSELRNTIPESVLKVARSVNHAMEFVESQAFNTYEKLSLGNSWLSMAWALAGDADELGKMEVSNAIRDVAPKDSGLPSKGLLTDYFVSELTGSWHAWADSVTENEELGEDAICRPDILVHTADTACHESLLQAALNSRTPLILVGPPGSGKTMTLFSVLRQMSQVLNLIPINFSSSAVPSLIINALEMHCEYTQNSTGDLVLAPSGTRWAVLFIDEINLPQPNQYGTVAILQFLRHFVERHGFYNKKGEFVKVERVQLVGACNPPPQRRAMPTSFSRHFITVHVGYPKRKALATIYSSFMAGIDPEAKILLDPMLSVYETLPQIVPNETWTPRELTRWTRGIHVSWNATSEAHRSRILLLKLWAYEAQRILGDRLIAEDKNKLGKLLSSKAPTGLEVNSNEIWSPFMSQKPKFVSITDLQKFFEARLTVFMEEAAGVEGNNLVVHDSFVLHVSQLDRVLRQPQGHGLFIGSPAVGKSTIVRFCCWLAGIDLTILKTHSQYNETEFTQDLRRTLFVALRKPCCLLLGKDILLKPDFVEQMNSLLANGEVPGLFSTPEQLGELEELSRRAGFAGGDLVSWVRGRIVSNLHIVFATGSTNNISPALLNRCTVIRIESWSISIKREVARHWCATTDAPHKIVDLLASSFDSKVSCRSSYSFIESCRQFSRSYTLHKSQLEESQRHFVGGSDKLKAAVLEIGSLKRKLAQQQEQLLKETKRSSDVLSQMLEEQSEAERKRAASIEIRSALEKQDSEIELRRRAANEDLEATEPLIRQAAEGVQNIRKAHLNELRAFTNPPEPVKITLEAVCLVLGLKTDGSWKQVLTAVRGDEFIPRIVKFDSERLSTQLISKVEENYISLPLFTYERVDRASKACGPLLRWVVAQVAYGRAVAGVQPLMAEIDLLNEQSLQSQAQLSAIESMVGELEMAIENSKREYSHAVGQCETLKVDMQRVDSQLQRAETLLASLGGEKERWTKSVSEFPEKLSKLPCKALLEAAHIAYGGSLEPKQKVSLRNQILDAFSEKEKSIEDLVLAEEDTGNIIIDNSWSVVLVIDPNKTWNPDSSISNLKISSFLLDPDTLAKELDTALRFGQHLIIQNAERFDPIISPILSRDFVRKGARLYVNLGKGDIDVAPGFKLTLHAGDINGVRQSSPHLLPKVNVVDFSVTEAAFEHMVTSALLKAQVPELAERREHLKLLKSKTSARLLTLERQLLTTLSEPETDKILENEALIVSLETIKAESLQLQQTQSSTTQTLAELESASEEFSSLASTAAEIYQRTQSLMSTNKFYSIGTDWIWEVVKSCAGSTNFIDAFSFEVNRRVLAVLNHRDWPESLISDEITQISLIDVVQECPAEKAILAGLATSNTSDPCLKLGEFAESNNIGFNAVAMGSSQACLKADKILTEAIELGNWVVIQNVEIASDDWLRGLARRMQTSKPHSNFRLIMTGLQSELVELPELVTSSRCVSVERERGVKLGLVNLLTKKSDILDFALCYIHSCFAEKFVSSNFSEPDLEAARHITKSETGSNGDETLETLKRALLVAVWGAKASNPDNAALMDSFLHSNLKAKSVFPDNFRDWAKQLPSDSEWLPKTLQ